MTRSTLNVIKAPEEYWQCDNWRCPIQIFSNSFGGHGRTTDGICPVCDCTGLPVIHWSCMTGDDV